MNSSKLSRRTLLQLAATALAATLASRVQWSYAQSAGGGDAIPMFQNPLFAGDFADPSIVRVGEDFYFTHTSYRYSPGLVVWHSRDLVNWIPISSALPLLKGEGEVWAPDLAEHKGRYFIYYPQNGRRAVLDCALSWKEFTSPVGKSASLTEGIDCAPIFP